MEDDKNRKPAFNLGNSSLEHVRKCLLEGAGICIDNIYHAHQFLRRKRVGA